MISDLIRRAPCWVGVHQWAVVTYRVHDTREEGGKMVTETGEVLVLECKRCGLIDKEIKAK